MKIKRNAVERTLGVGAAIAIVIAAQFIWQTTRSVSSQAVLIVYCASFVLVTLRGYLILRRNAGDSYRQHQGLSNLSLFLSCSIWGVFFSFPSLYSPYDWVWSWSREVHVVRLLSACLVTIGLLSILISVTSLGALRTLGHETDLLRTAGPYRYTRNPQLVSGALIVLGYAILRPSAYAVGWAILYGILTHMMVIAEEEHLSAALGEEYDNYRTTTLRYIGFPRKQQS
jgi:protein-S-isoprenylcysteine O-methyltransferase Ste14